MSNVKQEDLSSVPSVMEGGTPVEVVAASQYVAYIGENKAAVLQGVTPELTADVNQAKDKSAQNATAIQQTNTKLATVEGTANAAKSAAETAQQAATTADGKAAKAQETANAAKDKAEKNEQAIQEIVQRGANGLVLVYATKNFTIEDHKSDMEVGKKYLNAFNIKDQWLAVKDGIPADEQAPGVNDKNVSYWKISFKDSEGHLHVFDTKYDFTGVAYQDKENTFNKKQILEIEQTLTAGANQIQDNHIPKFGTVKQYVADEKFAKTEAANTFTQVNTFNQPVKITAEQNIASADNNEAVKVQTLKDGYKRVLFSNKMPTVEQFQNGLNCFLVGENLVQQPQP